MYLSAQGTGHILTSCLPSFPQAAAGGSANEQSDGGTGNWRGMLKKGDDSAAGERATPQSPFPSSTQKGYAVNLLDVVGDTEFRDKGHLELVTDIIWRTCDGKDALVTL